MSESERILSRQEIDALLRAINAGELPSGGKPGPSGTVTPLDFRRPQRLSRRELRVIQTIHEPLAQAMRDLLAPILRTPVEVQLAGVEQVTLAEFADAVASPTAVAVAAVEPGETSLLLEIDPLVAFPVVERMLGAGGPIAPPPSRSLREMDWPLLDRVMERLLERLGRCWGGIMVAHLKVRARETSVRAVGGLLPDETLVQIGFLVESEGRRGGVNVCLPSSLAERLVERQTASGAKAGSTAVAAVLHADVPVAVRLPAESILLRDLQALSPGDVLVSGQTEETPVLVEIGGVSKLAGRVGRLRGRRAVLVGEWLDEPGAQRWLQPGSRRLRRKPADRARAPEGKAVLAAPVEVRGVVAERVLALAEVANLRSGSVLTFPLRAGGAVTLEVGGRRFAEGAAVCVGERLGVQIASVQDPRQTLRGLG
ncbi:MAG: FliM/FliN family flagellar motor switch protein [Planctomycetes bacterium]|nr:FliM/FliN family flagellar motor switch protein [Planctomycetota bacterium]